MAFNLKLQNSVLFPKEKKQKRMVFVFIGAIIITGLVFYFGFSDFSISSLFSGGDQINLSATNRWVELDNAIKRMEFDDSFFNDPRLQNLTAYGEWPLEIGEKGRSNPFLPHQ